jgi:hypothetical protein
LVKIVDVTNVINGGSKLFYNGTWLNNRFNVVLANVMG